MNQPADPSVTESISSAWANFAQAQGELLDLCLERGELDEGSAASLLRRLIGNIQFFGLQLGGDPSRPMLLNPQLAPWNWGHSNPDVLYLSARIDDAHDYRVHGRLGSVSQTFFGVWTGKTDTSHAVKVLDEDLELEDDGTFEIFFTRERQGRNWYALPEGAETFGTYQTFGDWETQRNGTIRIECLRPTTETAAPRTAEQAVTDFEQQLVESRRHFTAWIKDIPEVFLDSLPRNQALAPMQPPAAMAGAWFSPIPWELQHDEALVIDYEYPAEARYVGFCLSNRWSQMFDIETRQTSLNLSQSQHEGNRVRVLLATEDFGIHNWLDARGYRSGTATLRITHPEPPPTAVVTKIKTSQIGDYFGPECRVSRQQRADAMASRLRHFENRNSP